MRILILCLVLLTPSVLWAQTSPEEQSATWVTRALTAAVTAPVPRGAGVAPAKQLTLVRPDGAALLVSSAGITDAASAVITAAQLIGYAGSIFESVSGGATIPADVSGRIWRRVANSLRSRAMEHEMLREQYPAWILRRTAQVAEGISEASHFAARNGRTIAGIASDIAGDIGDAGSYIRRAVGL